MENNESNSTGKTTGLIIGIVVVVLCICLIVVGIGGYAFYIYSQAASSGDLPVFAEPLLPNNPGEEEDPQIQRPPVDSISNETIETLENSIVPVNDPRELACRLDGKCGVPKVMAESAAPRSLGEKQEFLGTRPGYEREY